MGTVDKATANFRSPKEGEGLCQDCTFYKGDESCDLVEGVISPDGTCDLYKSFEDAGASFDNMLTGVPNANGF